MLTIKALKAKIVEGEEVLQGVDLDISQGQVHAIMGPNGSGKSTLSNVLMGNSDYEVLSGSVTFDGQDLLALSPDERAHAGLFMAFQYPVSIPGVSVLNFLQTVINLKRKRNNQPLLDAYDLIKKAEQACDRVGLDKAFLKRPLNDGFSGGEKKRMEVVQMMMLEPRLIIMDETDSGLDIDSLKHVSDAISYLNDGSRSFLVVTHYKRLLEHINPDSVHVFYKGRIIKSGDSSLADVLEAKGYAWATEEV